MEQENKKTGYSTCIVIRHNEARPEETCMVIEGFAEKMRKKTVEVNGENIPVVELELNTVLPDSRVRWLFGEEVLNEKHRVRFCITFWGKQAEYAAEYPPYEGQLLTVGFTNVRVHSWKTSDGTARYEILGTSYDGIGKRGWKRENAVPFRLDSPQKDEEDLEKKLEEMGIFDDENYSAVLPF